MSDAPPAIVVHGLRKEFDHGTVAALRGVELEVARGEWVALTGPSGCGKSTLLHLLAALDRPTGGTIEVLGRDLAALPDAAAYRRSTVGLVFQLHNLLPQLSAQQNVEIAMFGGRHDRTERRRRARDLLHAVDLDGREQRRPPRLSGGERQRVAIARALANDPPIVLADEPTGSLDSDAVRGVLRLFADLRTHRPDVTVLMVTHDPSVAARADRIVTLRDGAVERAGVTACAGAS
ncbi:MAG: ABC transporter ATP-binding protein [Jatrophihabitans sp.]|uniref:ABC transporter ATP-binding protein n=1 Tax=Jatrophihabitans sp. TaxID=1932789 RepID=UPI003F81AE99